MDNMTRPSEEEIDLKKLFIVIWNKKLLISCITSIAAVLSVVYALSLPNIYTSNSVLAPTTKDESLSSKLGAYSGIATLAGINVASNNDSKSIEAIRRIKSFDFFSNQFLPSIQLKNLLAVDEWIQVGNKIIYKKELYDNEKNKWVREVSYPQSKIPSNQEAFKVYKSMLSITTEDQSGFVSISIDHKSPIIAKKWLDIIIKNINESMREIDMNKAKNSINFLNSQSKLTSIQSIKTAVAKLQESQMQTLMMASSNKEYIFKILESPIVPEKKSSPNRAIICIMGTIFGGFFSLIIVFLQLYIKNSET